MWFAFRSHIPIGTIDGSCYVYPNIKMITDKHVSTYPQIVVLFRNCICKQSILDTSFSFEAAHLLTAQAWITSPMCLRPSRHVRSFGWKPCNSVELGQVVFHSIRTTIEDFDSGRPVGGARRPEVASKTL